MLATTVPGSLAEELACKPLAFVLAAECIRERHLENKVEALTRAIADAQTRFGVRYDIGLRIINHPANGGYSAPNTDVFTTVSDFEKPLYFINVTWYFLEQATGLLIEHASLHEVAHILNEDVGSYRKHGAQQEIAAEHKVYQLVGEKKYLEFYSAYLSYRGRRPALSDEIFIKSVRHFTPLVRSE